MVDDWVVACPGRVIVGSSRMYLREHSRCGERLEVIGEPSWSGTAADDEAELRNRGTPWQSPPMRRSAIQPPRRDRAITPRWCDLLADGFEPRAQSCAERSPMYGEPSPD